MNLIPYKGEEFSEADARIKIQQRLNALNFRTRMEEMDIFEAVLSQMDEDADILTELSGLSIDDQAKLPAIRQKMRNKEPLDVFERRLVAKATEHAEKFSKGLSNKTLRTIKRHNSRLLAIMAHSPIYPHEDRIKAQAQLEKMRGPDTGLSDAEVSAILAMPLAQACGKIAELSLTGAISKEQADHALRALDYRNEANLRDLLEKHRDPLRLPVPQSDEAATEAA